MFIDAVTASSALVLVLLLAYEIVPIDLNWYMKKRFGFFGLKICFFNGDDEMRLYQ